MSIGKVGLESQGREAYFLPLALDRS